MKDRIALVLLAAALLLPSCMREAVPDVSSGAETVTGPGRAEEEASKPKRESGGGPAAVVSGLRIPWSVQRFGETFYISERGGHIVVASNGSFDRQEVRLGRPVYEQGEGGFLGLALAPDFARTQTVYAYHTYRDGGRTYNRIVSLVPEGGSWREQDALLERIPGGVIHNGGRLAFGPDGMLYATTGDAGDEELPQNLQSLGGKILRMKPDGGVPEDNPFPGSYVYSYGHRNPQGIGWATDGTLYSTEHGPSSVPGGHDEINAVEPGGNYGWPETIGDESREGMIPPLYHTGEDTLAPSGMAVDRDGRVLAAGLAGNRLVRYTPGGEDVEVLLEGEGRLRDVLLTEDAAYILTGNTDGRGRPKPEDDRLLRIDLR